MQKVKSIDIDKLNAHLILTLVFFVPLIFTSLSYEEYEFPKTFFLYILGGTVIFLTLFKILLSERKAKLPDKYVSAFIFVYFLSTIFSSHFYTSVWGYYTRFYGGLVSIFILYGLYFSFINNKYFSDDGKYRNRLIVLLASTILPVFIYGISQHFNHTVRVTGTFGQPNWLAAYLAGILPLCFYLGLKSRGRERLWWSFLILVGFSCFWFTYSLSGILGLGAVLISFWVLNAGLVKKNLVYSSAVLVSFLVISAVFPGVFAGKVSDLFTDMKKVITETTGVYAQNTNLVSDPGFIRTGLWKGTINLAFSSFKNVFIGTGPETFPYRFPPFRPTELNYSSEWDFIFNKPHNYYLELLSNIGMPGLLLYLVLIYRFIRSRHPYILPAVIGLSVTNFFGWPTVPTALLFWIYLAFEFNGGREVSLEKVRFYLRLSAGLGLSVLFTVFIFTVAKFFFADLFFVSADSYLRKGNAAESLNLLNTSIDLNPNEPIYYRWRAKAFISRSSTLDLKNRGFYKSQALADLETAYSLNPHNLATLRNSVPLYYYMAVNNYSGTVTVSDIDWKYLPVAADYIQKVKAASSTDVGLYVLTANYENKLGLTKELGESVEKIKLLRPDLLEWHESLRDIHVRL